MMYRPDSQVYWYLETPKSKPLNGYIAADVVIVGGGMAGLSAAQEWHKKGKKVVLVEQYYCGAGATGKGSGFITPDSEIPLRGFVSRFGDDKAKKLWEFVVSGCSHIKQTISEQDLSCDYNVQDTLVVANDISSFKELKEEDAIRKKYGYPSTLYTKSQLSPVLNSNGYYGGVRYPDTFGINAAHYCAQLKNKLIEQGIQIYEETPAIKIENNMVYTPHGSIKAEQVIVCADRFMPQLGLLTDQVFHAQTFLMISEPLTDEQIKAIFPEKLMMVWDTDLIYSYFRITGDKRLLLGGASILNTYDKNAKLFSQRIYNKLDRYFALRFKTVKPVFSFFWPGLIGVSKDLVPIAGPDKNKPWLFYVTAATGLPWAAALGKYSADYYLHNNHSMQEFFSPYRSFYISGITQKILGTRISFVLSHAIEKFIKE